jgi:TM2 domain-containing membrane protein YozV/RNA polymerase subunit RPABC4/transcription elongation factor Spt4
VYCRNCGNVVADQAVICPKCGVAPLNGRNVCWSCGQQTNPLAEICVKCGVRLTPAYAARQGTKSKLAAGLLGIFLGGFGVHRFYLGYIGIGIAQIVVTLITFGFGALWGFIEGILILVGSMNKDAMGYALAD